LATIGSDFGAGAIAFAAASGFAAITRATAFDAFGTTFSAITFDAANGLAGIAGETAGLADTGLAAGCIDRAPLPLSFSPSAILP
jgi:hypothetical protein